MHMCVITNTVLLFVCLVAVMIEAEEYTGYGTWHFFTLFILTAAVAIICYFGVLNRKRVCGYM